MLICGGATYYNSLNVTNANMMSKNLIEVGQKMARAKKFDANWLFFGIPAVIVWLAWLVWELYQLDADTARYSLYGVVCGAILGSIVGIKIHTRTLKQYQDIIDQIEDLTKE
jgi:membrane associated rhomboid family serine protease